MIERKKELTDYGKKNWAYLRTCNFKSHYSMMGFVQAHLNNVKLCHETIVVLVSCIMCHCAPQNQLYVVVDTSILLTHLGLLTKHKDTAISGVGRPVFVIPWVVLQELDRLYEHANKQISVLVGNTVQFLTDAMESNHPRVIFQTYDEVHYN